MEGSEERFTRPTYQVLDHPQLASERLAQLTALLKPHTAVGFNKTRLGNKHDSGYVCIDDFANLDGAISLGIGGDVSWDLDLVNRVSIPVHQFDHTVSRPPVRHDLFRFTPKKIGAVSDRTTTTIGDIALHSGYQRPQSLFLKIDIEDAEYEVFDAIKPETLGLFAQIVGEFHGFDRLTDDVWFASALRIFEKLADQFCVVHVHANNYAPLLIAGTHTFPHCLELSLVHRARYAVQESEEVYPGPLDYPNNWRLPDIWLGRFVYSN